MKKKPIVKTVWCDKHNEYVFLGVCRECPNCEGIDLGRMFVWCDA